MKRNVSCPSLDKMDKIKLGICAMGKKVNSTHMKNILDNFNQFEEFRVITFSEDIIFKTEIENWPIVDALIIFFSDGFPYNKGLKYINLRKPYLVNDFEMQKVFWDRVKVLKMLEEENIPTPSHIIVDRGGEINNDGENNSGELNTSAEKEKKVENYKLEINELIKNENKINNLKSNIRKINTNQIKKKDIIKKENEMEKIKNMEKIRRISINNNTSNTNINKKDKDDKDELIELDDHIEYKGKKLYKPFVEKPFNGDDHNIYIYYPPNLGGGHKRLFRKTKELSSLYFPNLNEIRRDKSYIYEEFLQSDGFDVKVYTIGPDNFHAEARKSPTLDGKVNRSAEGKEVRIAINLTAKEKEIAKKIVLKFKQNICGFDILRCQGNSYVCDVNGFSFVKGNKKYYKNCSNFLRKNIKQGLKIESNEIGSNKNTPIFKTLKLPNKQINSIYHKEELRSIIAVFRHADRSPKEKMKLIVEDEQFLSLFNEFGKKNNKNKKKEIKLKKPKELLRVLEIVNDILENNKDKLISIGADNFFTKIFQIKMVLEQKINFDGLTRKIQMKPLKFTEILDENGNKTYKITQALMILKWGGNLTHAGIEQARKLGSTFLCRLYPNYQDKTIGLLKLHSTYRHDLKCYSSDEGRCLKTAASFLKGLLQLDGPIIPIISSMVRTDEDVNKLLDDSESIQEFKGKIKEKLNECLNYDGEIKEKFYSLFPKEKICPKEEVYEDINNESKSIEEEEDDIDFESDNLEPIDDNKSSSNSAEYSEGNNNYYSSTNIYNVCNNNNCFKMDYNEMNKNQKKVINNYSPYNTNNEDKNKNNNSNDNINKGTNSNPFDELLEQIGNPLKRLKRVLSLMKKVITNIQTFLPNTQDSSTYFITDESQILKREYDHYNKKKLIKKILGEEISERKGSDSTSTERKLSGMKCYSTLNNNEEEVKEKDRNNSENREKNKNINDKDTINTLNEVNFECKEENIILIYKRYVKLKNDFFNNKKNKFDVSKIPDIYDNIKYDIIHNKDLMNNSSYELFEEISLLANFVMPFEYGITSDEKLNIGLKIISPLLKKMYSDLIDINSNFYSNEDNIEKEDKNWSGLDATNVDENEIKMPERHVKSRFYFTCASHMYALLNVIGYGYNSSLTHRNRKSIEKLKKIFDLDYCSHIIFRLFENLNVDFQNPKRFRLEIIMSPGSNRDPREANEEHLINVSPWILLNKNLNLAQMKEFLNKFN